jgi:preprotein translocase subunit YajC
MHWLLTLAQTTDAAASTTNSSGGAGGFGGGGGGSMLLFGGLALVAMYFLMIRPQRKQEKSRQQMLAQIDKNDHVVTIGGIKGIVYSVGDDDVVLKIDERNDVRIRVTKSAVAHILTEDEVKSGAESDKKAE